MKDSKKNFIINKFKTEDLKGFEKFQNDIKEFIFGTFYILLKNDSESYVLFFLTRLIEFMQLIFFSFQLLVLPVWKNDGISKLVHNILNKVDIIQYFYATNNSVVFLVIFYLGLFKMIFYTGLFIYIGFLFNKSIFSESWKVIIFKNASKLLSSCLYLPLMLMFFSVFDCNASTNTDSAIYMTYSINIQCYSGFHFLHIFAGVLGIILVFCSGLMISLVYFEYSTKYNNLLSKHTTKYDFVLLIVKTALVVFYIFLPQVIYIIFLIYLYF